MTLVKVPLSGIISDKRQIKGFEFSSGWDNFSSQLTDDGLIYDDKKKIKIIKYVLFFLKSLYTVFFFFTCFVNSNAFHLSVSHL